MSALFPFRALRPAPDAAARVASVPYDVVSVAEARAMAAGNPLNFLHVTRAEIDLPPSTPPYDATVYAQAVRNFEDLKRAAPLMFEDAPSLYFYRLRMGQHEQTGLAGCFSVAEYDADLIKKHEKTRPDKEDDRTRHLIELRAQTGVVFLTYRASSAIDTIASRTCAGRPVYAFTADDGVAHSIWKLSDDEAREAVAAFAALPALYIADGHHRAASASRAHCELRGTGESGRLIAVAFPDSQLQILPYHRLIKDLAGQSADQFLSALRAVVTVRDDGPASPVRRGEVAMYFDGQWRTLTLASPPAGLARADALDVEQLHRQVLGPVLKVADPRIDARIDFVGGIRGTAELERLVTAGKAAVAFSMFPVTVDDLMTVADAGGIMPPKSTWFEPKLRDGLLVHAI